MNVSSLCFIMVLIISLCSVECHLRPYTTYLPSYRTPLSVWSMTRYPWLPQYSQSTLFSRMNQFPYLPFQYFNQQGGQVIPMNGVQQSSFLPVRREFLQTDIDTQQINANSCQNRGCGTGEHCIYSDNWICPNYIPYLNCKCAAGCRAKDAFIPLRSTVVVDKCGSTCTCLNIYGETDCDMKRCNMKK